MNKIILPVLLVLMLGACDKESENYVSGTHISFIASIPGGCNGIGENDLKSTFTENDTVTTTLKNDTLNVFVGINYICCAPFISDAEIENDTILMTITDTCSYSYQSCYCRCMCYYTWIFQFNGFENGEYPYKVYLNDPREDKIKVFKEGKIILSKK